MKKIQLFLVLVALSVSSVWAQLDLNQTLPKDPDVIYGVLDNGMTYYIRHNETPKNRAELTIITRTGSIQEDEDQRGLAHFVEHMAFNGTKNFPKHELVNFLEKTGMKFGAEVNAYTTFDETVFGITVPLDSASFLDKGLLVLHDWSHLVTFEDKEIDAERGVIHEEWRTRQGAQTRMQKKLFGAIFKDSKYAERIPIGLMSVVDSCEYDALRRYYRDWYTPNRQAVIVVGDFDSKAVEAKVKKLFGAIPARKKPREYVQVDIPDNNEPIVAIMTDKENPSTSIQIYVKQPKFYAKTIGDYKTMIEHQLFNQMLSNRLQELTLADNPPFIYGGAGYGEFIGPKDVFMSIAATKEDGIEAGAKAVYREGLRVKRHGFTATELERTKKMMLKMAEKMYNDRNKQKSASYVDEYKANFLISQTPFVGAENDYKYMKDLLKQITVQDVNKFAKEWITDRNMVVLVSAPEKEGLKVPNKEEVLGYLEGVKKEDIPAYVDKVSTRPFFDDAKLLSSTGKVVKTSKDKNLGTTTWVLSNGITVILKPTDFKDDEIKMSAYSYGGTSVYDLDDLVSAQIATDVIQESGLNGFDKIELEKMLSDKTVWVAPYISELSEGFNGNSSVADFKTMLELVHLYFVKPRYDKTAYNSFLDRTKSAIKNKSLSPETAFSDSIASVLSNRSPRRQPLSEARLDEANYKRVHKIYRERFEDPSSFTFIFVGNLDLEKAKPLVEKYLGGLENANNNENYVDLNIRYPKGKIDVKAIKGTEPKSVVFMQFNQDMDYSLKERVALKALSKILSIGLIEDIREEHGWVYSISAFAGYDDTPYKKGNISVYFPCSPENIENATNGTLALFKKINKEGPSAENLSKAKQQLLKELETNMRENRFWLNKIKSYSFSKEETADFNKIKKTIESLNKKEIMKVAKKYLNENNYVRIALIPENM